MKDSRYLRLDLVWAHHLVVFVVNYVAVPHVAWSCGWVKGIFVETSPNCTCGQVLWCPASYDAGDLSGEHFESVFPADFPRLRRLWRVLQEWSYIRVSSIAPAAFDLL